MAKRFYRTEGLARFFNPVYWWPVLPYDSAWDRWLQDNIKTARPAYWPGNDQLIRENQMIWIDDQPVWVCNDPGTFGVAVRWQKDERKFGAISGRPSRETQRLLRRELAAIEKSLDVCDAQAALQGPDGPDVLSISG